MKDTMKEHKTAFIDGMITGMDPLGYLAGLAGKDLCFGYLAQKYSHHQIDTVIDRTIIERPRPAPIKRTLTEKVANLVGAETGLVLNVLMLGLPQGHCLGINQMSYDILKSSKGAEYIKFDPDDPIDI
ncbi:MAG: hypothetical protein ABIA37_05295 [Candidatus Woesearchaeota archaeon]